MNYIFTKAGYLITLSFLFASCATVKIPEATYQYMTAGRKNEKPKLVYSIKLHIKKTSSISSLKIEENEIIDNTIIYAIPSGETFKKNEQLNPGKYRCQVKLSKNDIPVVSGKPIYGSIALLQKNRKYKKLS